jgi:DNA-binding PadR family transcriptional regulator
MGSAKYVSKIYRSKICMCDEKTHCCCHHPGTGLIQLEILRILYENPTHGYQIMEGLRKFTLNEYAPEPGAIYTMLRRLEQKGLVTSRWEKKTSRLDRRVYTITKEGEEFLRGGLRVIKKRRELMDDLVRFHDDNLEKRVTSKRKGRMDR